MWSYLSLQCNITQQRHNLRLKSHHKAESTPSANTEHYRRVIDTLYAGKGYCPGPGGILHDYSSHSHRPLQTHVVRNSHGLSAPGLRLQENMYINSLWLGIHVHVTEGIRKQPFQHYCISLLLFAVVRVCVCADTVRGKRGGKN